MLGGGGGGVFRASLTPPLDPPMACNTVKFIEQTVEEWPTL